MNTPQSETPSHPDLLPSGYIKQGTAALVEHTVSNVVRDSVHMDEYFGQLAVDGDAAVSGETTTGRWLRARLRRQAAEAVGSYAVCQIALPRMTEWYQEHGTLAIPEEWLFDPYEHAPHESSEPDTELYATALRGAFWIVDAARSFLSESKADTSHPFHRLHYHLEQNWQDFVITFEPYHEEQTRLEERRNKNPEESARAATRKPGKWQDTQNYTYEDVFMSTHLTNVGVGIDLMAASAIHHVINNRGHSVQDLAAGAQARLPSMRWSASADRHTGAHKAKLEGLDVRIIPEGAANLLGKQLATAASIEELIAPFLAYRVVHDPEFCPAETLRHGPPPKPGKCAGDVNAKIASRDHQQTSTSFFAEMGLPGLGRNTLSTATVALAISKRQAETVLFPQLASFLQMVPNTPA